MKYNNIGYDQFLERVKDLKPERVLFDRHWLREHFWFDEYSFTAYYASEIVSMFAELHKLKVKVIGVNLYNADKLKDL